MGAVVVSCVLSCAGGALAGERITVAYKNRFLIETISGEVVSREKDVLVLSVWKGGGTKEISIPFADLREIGGEPAAAVIGRWRGVSEEAGPEPEGPLEEDSGPPEMVTIVYREGFSVKTVYGELLDRGGDYIKLLVAGRGRKRLLMVMRSNVKAVNGEPASRVFARWDKVVPVDAAGSAAGSAAESEVAEPVGPVGAHVLLRYRDGYRLNGIAGSLVTRDMRRVVVRATVEGRLRDVAILWKDLRRYNGRPSGEEFKRFRGENIDRLCPDCKGGTVLTKCDLCAGTGWTSDKFEKCPACGETGLVRCRAPGCRGGYLQCPGPCLKRSEGRWVKNWDGKFWRKFGYGNGQVMAFSEDKVGQLMKRIDGIPRLVGPCPVCGGSGGIPCPACTGTGKETCPRCGGAKKIPSQANAKKCPRCDRGIAPCKRCGDTGLLSEREAEREKKKEKVKEEKEGEDGKQ